MEIRSSANATSYTFCYDTTDNGICDTQESPGAPGVTIQNQGFTPGVTYYWQAWAINANGKTPADSGAWSRFTVSQFGYQLFMPWVAR